MVRLPTSGSRDDVTAWLSGQTRLTHEEANVVRELVDGEYVACGGRREVDRRKLHRDARAKLMPVVGLWAWLQIASWVWSGIKLLLWLYDNRTEEHPAGAAGNCGFSRAGRSGEDDFGEDAWHDT
ncbi:hypothetical protein UFOVP1004_12 [uncultured Caudovirales phage]|uniref:Uncharacterized protein n=1 Tax=uncultured Caudovirales phage TaxID=2100421 RepID=A0A6J5Q0J5_9CAUD|nr:hypothetical protein UFOVP1004_12 [uncultured Caudovirales phage]